MKLASLTFDDNVLIYAGKDVGGGLPRQDLRDSSFRAEDGWSLLETSPGVFSVHCDGMPKPVIIGGYGYSYVEADVVVVDAPKKGKR